MGTCVMHRSSKHHNAVRFLARNFFFVEVRVNDVSKVIRMYLWTVPALEARTVAAASVVARRGAELRDTERVFCP